MVTPRQTETMEGMRIKVQSVDVRAEIVRAVVIAVSLERVLGKARASLRMHIFLETVEEESVRRRFARVREEALRFLDVG
jgi:hypothetical protein